MSVLILSAPTTPPVLKNVRPNGAKSFRVTWSVSFLYISYIFKLSVIIGSFNFNYNNRSIQHMASQTGGKLSCFVGFANKNISNPTFLFSKWGISWDQPLRPLQVQGVLKGISVEDASTKHVALSSQLNVNYTPVRKTGEVTAC